MRCSSMVIASGLVLALAGGAAAQPPVAETARQAETPATAEASALQGYVLMLQEAQLRLRAAQEKAAQEPATYNRAAMTPARQELMQEVRNLLRAVENAPPEATRTEIYRETVRELRQAFDEAGPGWQRGDETGQAAASQALAAVDRLREELAGAAAAAGGAVPAPPVASGGGR
ncbi:hypothetical protein [Crenalkalicoccus roseus]|uniref:hypothetical protein n=1 Tax=Crenalkalicoccus roseus TaxID=1485588 RepID=UPI00108197F2|nr:hypothetical protein [Crenalkalicoccus roseus]